MRISPALVQVQQRVAELQALSGQPAALRTPAAPATDFQRALAEQMGSTTRAQGTTQMAATGAAGVASSTTAAGTHPSSLYSNGRIPSAALESIGHGHHKLWGPAATSLRTLMADARRAGVRIGVTDSYRTHAEQVDLVRRKGLYSQGGLAAKPGTSQHGWGLAVDLDLDATAQRWMRANAHRYGFVEDTPREPWHWAYKGI